MMIRYPGSNKKIFKASHSAGKPLDLVFLGQTGVMLLKYMYSGTAMNSDFYVSTLSKLSEFFSNESIFEYG